MVREFSDKSDTYVRMPHSYLWVLLASLLFVSQAATLPVTVKDPSGAVVAGAQVQVKNARGEVVKETATGPNGSVSVPDLPEGDYTVVVTRPGFETKTVTVHAGPADLPVVEISLAIEKQETAADVTGSMSTLANSDPIYRALRTSAPSSSYRVEKLTLQRDLGQITFTSGTIDFMPKALGRVVMAVFSGEGVFHLKPELPLERNNIERLTGAAEISEEFKSAVLCFTDTTYEEIVKSAKPTDGIHGADVLKEFRSRMRRRNDRPRSMMEALLGGESVANVEAELLGDLYEPAQTLSFSAYFHGKKHADLRFLIRPRGALPQLMSPEEVAVLYVDPGAEAEGIWYLTHLASEWKSGAASSMEDKRVAAMEHYRIETAIGGNDHMSSTCEIGFRSLASGPRVLKFALLPALRVTRVALDGKDVAFIQESRKEDGSFYVILPSPVQKDEKHQLTFEYEGNKVVEKAGGGTFYVRARDSWYPNPNAFGEHSTFDLTFKVPKRYTLVSVGKLVKEWKEGNSAATHWVSETPLAVAGFNYGDFKRKARTDETAKYSFETYASSQAPDYLNGGPDGITLTPSSMAESAMTDAQNAIRTLQPYFGPLPYGRIAITQQPDFSFGQSWPSLVYLPVSAFLDSTRRWQLLGQSAFKFANFIEEVTPHEVAHQWWGHVVSWASYHDQWLSEGFADFSAGLYLQFVESKPERFLKYWDRQRKAVLDKNEFGQAANDAGPIWMGLRLDSRKNAWAYNHVVYSKGAYVLHMLRMLMRDEKSGDAKFIEMMQDFVKTHYNANASTESFKAVAEKHMPQGLDLEGNQRLDWFFRQWVYGTEIPKYRLEYSISQADGGWLVKGALTQSGVSDNFLMRVPIYVEMDGKTIRLGLLLAHGNTTGQEFQVKLPKRPKRLFLNAWQDILAAEAVSKEL